MTNRLRSILLAALALSAVVSAAGSDAPSTSAPATVPVAREALGQLKAGNDRFARNASLPVPLGHNRRQALSGGEQPFAMVLSCADSRIPPEHVFNTGLGELLVIRSAGQVVDRSLLATMEYGADQLHVPLLVVMGHESCSVVKAAADSKSDTMGPNLDYLMKSIQAGRGQGPKDGGDGRALILANVEQVLNDALAKSQILRAAVDAGRLQVVGAYYELGTGRVTFSDPISSSVETARAATARH